MVRGTRGWLSWQAGQADHFEFGFADSPQVIQAGLRNRPPTNFEQSFLAHLLNVIAALRGTEALRVPAAEGIAGIELIEHCYRHRSLMAMPWLDDSEIARGRALNGGQAAGVVAR